jgi:hypothetical protein
MSTTLEAQTDKPTPNPWVSGLIGGALAFVGSLVLYGIARLLGIPLQVGMGPPGQNPPVPLGVGQILIVVLVATLAATLIYVLLRRFFMQRADRIFQYLSLVVLLLSLGGPLTLPVSVANKVILALMHLVSAAAIVWGLTLRR